VLLNHVHRTWWFAEFIGKKREMNYDSELVYVGLCSTTWPFPRNMLPTSASKWIGADAASRFLHTQAIQR